MDTYAESSYKGRCSGGIWFFRIIFIILTVLLVVFALLTGILIFIFPAFVTGYFAYYGFVKMEVEYEIVYCDGQFDFDKISGMRGRKTLFQVEMDEVEMIAPLGHDALSPYQDTPVARKVIPVKGDDYYVMIVGDGEGNKSKVLFYPNEKMLDCIYHKAPSKLKK